MHDTTCGTMGCSKIMSHSQQVSHLDWQVAPDSAECWWLKAVVKNVFLNTEMNFCLPYVVLISQYPLQLPIKPTTHSFGTFDTKDSGSIW